MSERRRGRRKGGERELKEKGEWEGAGGMGRGTEKNVVKLVHICINDPKD